MWNVKYLRVLPNLMYVYDIREDINTLDCISIPYKVYFITLQPCKLALTFISFWFGIYSILIFFDMFLLCEFACLIAMK